MSVTPTDSPSAPNGLPDPVARPTFPAPPPLDFSGATLFVPENSRTPPPDANAPIDAADALALTDALCAKISPVSFGDRVFLFASEADAWRCATQMVRRYHAIVGRPKRRRFIVCAGEGAEPTPPDLEGDEDIVILRTDDHAALQAAVDIRTAGILIAPIRTKTGFEVVPGSVLAQLRETADEYGLMLAFDESFCGFGRSGMLWAHEWTGVTPDLMVATHAPADAPPLAALVTTQRVARGAQGGPPPCLDREALVAGHMLMDALSTPGFQERVQNRSWRLEDQLAALFYRRRSEFAGLSGLGLMQGLALAGDAEPMRVALAERGLLTRAMGSVLGLFPPLTVEEIDIDAAAAAIDLICAREEL